MKRFPRSLACSILVIGAVTGCSSQRQASADDQRETLDRIRREVEAAENAGSVDRMRVHFADDVVMMAPTMPAVTGVDSAEQAMRQFFDTFGVQIQYASSEIVVSGDWGFDRGTFSQTLTPKAGGAPIKETGKYLWLYRRAPDGAWKHTRVIWNSSDPLRDCEGCASPPGVRARPGPA
jgi:ketosteroid isomerase-like protein